MSLRSTKYAPTLRQLLLEVLFLLSGSSASGKYFRNEYSCAMKSHFRKFGNQMSGSGNHLCNYASLLA